MSTRFVPPPEPRKTGAVVPFRRRTDKPAETWAEHLERLFPDHDDDQDDNPDPGGRAA